MDGSMDTFLKIVAEAPASKAPYLLFHWYYFHSLFRWVRQ
jgi:hypothetical protein